jgi:site-specific DNA-cytosine methylase
VFMTPVLSICTGIGILDRAFINEGFDVIPTCEPDNDLRRLYIAICGATPMYRRLQDFLAEDLAPYRGFPIIGGPPCQHFSRLVRNTFKHRWEDLTDQVIELVSIIKPAWYLFENVTPIKLMPEAEFSCLDAMHYGTPPQSRPRWFTHSPNLKPPRRYISGDSETLMAYPAVTGNLYGLQRAAILQGYPAAVHLPGARSVLRGLANAVSFHVAEAWAKTIKKRYADDTVL